MSEQKCCFKECENRGEPQEGFDFYMCEQCGIELERLLNQMYKQREDRHSNN